ncbi:hypothetical protein M433DRAFT_140434 [Acidomyces richmondensis BFW]|nr:MAG: hypothetical protein FE78DRAFT_83650 [Acidomyces sp. 'richmondensis']KYG49077.1 hypothetical protein M433DRAFT_140434 [Acidomyces richmondensis BFW]
MAVSCGTRSETLTLERFAKISLRTNTPKGRGVFAGAHIASGTIIDTCPVLVLDATESSTHVEKTSLSHYTYNWPLLDTHGNVMKGKTQAVVFGLGSMFNHSTKGQNVGWERDLMHDLVIYRALRDINEGEELCISYGNHLTFVDVDRARTDVDEQDIAQEAEELLRKIQLE